MNEGTKWNENKWSEINDCMNECNEMTDWLTEWMEWNGTERNGMEWMNEWMNEWMTEWNEMEWNGLDWNGMEWHEWMSECEWVSE